VSNIRLLLSYDGTAYHGFQRQPEFHGPTIQGTLEAVWRELSGEEVVFTTAGRTDAGVHAAGQVVNFHSGTRIPRQKIPKAFNSLLPRDIRVLSAEDVADDFNARHDAKWKRYDYRIDNRPIPNVFQRIYALHEPIPLEVKLMREAAQLLEGTHDFRAFAASSTSSKTFTRTLYRCAVRHEAGLLCITCIGDGFLYNMVRIIAGTLLDAGKGRLDAAEIPAIIASGERRRARETAPPHGLTLTYVHYGAETPREVFPELFLQAGWDGGKDVRL